MYPALIQRVLRRSALAAAIAASAIAVTAASDWPEWRGPSRDGHSLETNLPAKWSPKGENLAWRIPIGSRSSPVVFGNRLYLNSPVGDLSEHAGSARRDRCRDRQVVWEKRFSQYLSDVPQHRASWASPAVDPETGQHLRLHDRAQLICVAPGRKIVWDRSLPDEYGAVTTHGGPHYVADRRRRQGDPQRAGAAWGDLNRTGNRYFAVRQEDGTDGVDRVAAGAPLRHELFDADRRDIRRHARDDRRRHRRRVSRAEGQHRREDLVDRSQQARDSQQRAVQDNVAYITHGEENMDTTEMGMIAAVDATKTGVLAKTRSSGARSASCRRSPRR
jgi:hypothetical protein